MESIKEPCVSSHIHIRTIRNTAWCFQQLIVKNICVLKLRFSVLVLCITGKKKEDTAIVATHNSVCGGNLILFGPESFELVV
jgi:hypothetical protein